MNNEKSNIQNTQTSLHTEKGSLLDGQKYVDPLLHSTRMYDSWTLLWALPCCYNSLQLSGKVFPLKTRTLQQDLLPFRLKSISKFKHWCWVLRPGSQSVFPFIPNVLDGVEFRHCAGQLSSQTPKRENNVFISNGLAFTTTKLSCWNRKQPCPDCCHINESMPLPNISLHIKTLRFNWK